MKMIEFPNNFLILSRDFSNKWNFQSSYKATFDIKLQKFKNQTCEPFSVLEHSSPTTS